MGFQVFFGVLMMFFLPRVTWLPNEIRAEPTPSAPTPSSSPVRRKLLEKEAEGTKAPNRFEAEIVIKSQYTLDGQPLEVDPD